MKQVMIKTYGAVGRAQALAFVKKAHCQVMAYWVQSKNPLNICVLEKLNGNSPITWMHHTCRWWSATLTIDDKARKERII